MSEPGSNIERQEDGWARYRDLDPAGDPTLRELVDFAADICDSPIAAITLRDGEQLRFVSAVGFNDEGTSLQDSLCAHALTTSSPLIVDDLQDDERFNDREIEVGGTPIRFYAGYPMIAPDGLAVGTVCVMGKIAHRPTPRENRTLKLLASQAITHLELRRQVADDERILREQRATEAALRVAERKFRDIFEHATDGIFQTSPEGRFIAANSMLASVYGFKSSTDLLEHFDDIANQLYVEPGRREEFRSRMREADLLSGFESRIRRRDGQIRWISENARAVRAADDEILYYEGTVEDITDRKNAEVAVRDSERQFRSVWNNSADGMRLNDKDGIIQAVNPAYCRIVGMSEADLVGKPYTIIYADQSKSAQRIESFRINYRDRAIPEHVEQQFEFRDGKICELELSNSFLEFEGRDPLVLSIFHDLTDRKLAEVRLRESELLYHSLVDHLPQNIFRKDAAGRFTFVNDGFCREVGKKREEIIGRTDFDLFPRALAEKYQKDDHRLIESGQAYETVEAHYVPQLGKIYVQVVKSPLYDTQGKPAGIQGIFWDVTERKRIEEQLAFERDLLRALLDNVPDRIYFKDTESRFLQVSLAMAQRLGLNDPAAAVGKRDEDFHAAELAREFFEDEQRILMTGSPLINKVERQFANDGSEIWASVTKVPTRNRAGFINGIIGISRDITKIKQAEEELAKARDAALESTRLKSQFLAAMSHEIRTPMNGIIGMTDLLLDTELAPAQREFAGTIHNSAHALLHIINDILDFSKIEAGKMVIETAPFDVVEVVEDSVELLAPRAQAKNLDAVCHLDRNVPGWLIGDSVRLRQVIVNLLGNAIKFTEQGQVKVHVSTLECSDESAVLRFSISDTGIGIEPDVQSRIFEAFTQADGTTTRRYGGTGLGLSISRQLVELMDGSMDLISDAGRGSDFRFDIRFPRTEPPADRVVSDPGLAGSRILVAVHNRDRATALVDALSVWNIHAETAHSATTVLDRLRAAGAAGEPLDVILLDLKLDDIDGLTLSEQIHHDPSLPEVRLVLLTPLGQRLDREILRLAGFSAALLKPVRRPRLRACLVRLLLAEEETSWETNMETQVFRRGRSDDEPIPLRILLVEDNTVNQQVALLQLRKLGYTPELVMDGREAVEAFRKGNYELVLMDCQMPVMDGYTATRLIREFERQEDRARTPIFAMTADVSVDHETNRIDCGMDGSVTKPVHLPDLRDVVYSVAEHRLSGGDSSVIPKASKTADQPGDDGAEPVLEMSVINSLRELGLDDGDDPAAELAALFLEDAPRRLADMSNGIAARDPEHARIAAHSLKGSARNLGALALARISQETEELVKEEEWDKAHARLSAVEAALDRLTQHLREEKLVASADPDN